MQNESSGTRVAHLSSAHPWDDTRIFGRLCRSLARHGYDVTFVVADADAPPDHAGVRIAVAPVGAGRVRRLLVAVPRVLVTAWHIPATVYHLHDPELAVLIPLLRARGARVVYDAHEDLPSQVLDKHYLPRAVRPLVAGVAKLLCAFVDRTADHVIAATPTIAERFRSAHCTVVHNFPELLEDVDGATDYEQRDPVIAYVGGIGPDRCAVEMIDAMHLAHLPEGWRLRLVGPSSPSGLRAELAARPGWALVDDLGAVSPRRARELTATARIGLNLCYPSLAHIDSLPTKLFEYMAAGLPVVASDFPLWRRLIGEADCGLLVDPTDPAAIAKALTDLAGDPDRARAMGERGRAAVLDRLNWQREEGNLLGVYERLGGR